ncbi:MAG: T9SS type A sorting domain-containing protein, partial [Candidatus Cloacimonetes bacterium]|nr:T9SS type A sorting domain-containing protein [Candidatus Cloacimonadota bacterium]
NGAGKFIIAWDDSRNDWNPDIYAQRYDVGGNPQGPNFLVNDDTISEWQFTSSIAIDAEGSFVIAWTDFRNFWDFIADIYAQRYDENGVPQDSNFRVNDDIGPYDQYETSIAMDNIGNFVIAWQDFRNGDNPDIYAQKYDEDGIPQDSNFKVNDDVESHIHWWPSVTMAPQGDRFVIAWTDYRNPDGDPDIVAQKYENGIPVDANVQINEPDSLSYDRQWSWGFCTACNDDIIAFTWMDTRRHKGWDIYGKITDWELITGTDEDNSFTINTYSLAQNYPNPFNPETTISFSITQTSPFVTLEIFNIKGQKVKTLVDEKLEAGNHQVVWDGKNENSKSVSSGIYFYKMNTVEYTSTKKMILMK